MGDLGYIPLQLQWEIIVLSPANWCLSCCKDRHKCGQNGEQMKASAPENAITKEKLP